MTRSVLLLACSLAVLPATIAHAQIVLLPAESSLSTPESRQRLVVQEVEHGEVGRQLVDKIEWSSSDDAVATVVAGLVTPVKDGQATILAKLGDRTATAKVKVSGMSQLFAWSFRNHVEPVLARQGCNAGACHGRLRARADSGSRSRVMTPTAITSTS